LIAAAHAACFSMALSNTLAQAGHPPDSVHTDATVTLRRVDDRPTITKIELVTVGRVPGLDEATFVEQGPGGEGRVHREQSVGRRARDHARSLAGALSNSPP